jgi:hypothetical protein
VKIEFKEKRKEVTQADKDERKKLADDLVIELKETKIFSVISDKYKLTHENVVI